LLKLLIKLLKFLLLIILVIIISLKYYEITYFKPYLFYVNEIYIQGKKEEYFTEKIRNIILCLNKPKFEEDSIFFLM